MKFNLLRQSDIDSAMGFMEACAYRAAHNQAFAKGDEHVTYQHPLSETHVARMTMEDSIKAWAKLYANVESVTILFQTEDMANLFLNDIREKLKIDTPHMIPQDLVAMNLLYRLLTRDDNEVFDQLIKVKDNPEEYINTCAELLTKFQVNKTVNLINTILIHCDTRLTEIKIELKDEKEKNNE